MTKKYNFTESVLEYISDIVISIQIDKFGNNHQYLHQSGIYPITDTISYKKIDEVIIPNCSVIAYKNLEYFVIGNKPALDSYMSDVKNGGGLGENYKKYIEEFQRENALFKFPEFENNPELYKLWKEDPEGFDDYRRGKQASENK